MDKIDRKILAELQRNARASLQEIGQAVGLSPSPCWTRIKRMEDEGVIEGYTVRISPQAVGLNDTVLLMVTDVLNEGTQLFCVGDREIVERAFDVSLEEGSVWLPGVLSRKKQLVPRIIEYGFV